MLEAGRANTDWRITTPGMMAAMPKRSNWGFETVPQMGLAGRRGYQPRGRGFGGSSAINAAMLYIRGNRWDYDNWAALDCPGWSYDDVLPFFRASEDNEDGANAFHGVGGPLSVVARGRGGVRTIRARGAVVLAGGAFGTPQTLMLSGIGSAAHLAELGIAVALDRPAVGSDLQDHPDYVSTFVSPRSD